MTDNASDIERLVLTAIKAVQSGDRDRVNSAYEALAHISTLDVIAELFLCIQDYTEGVDLTELLDVATLPLPPKPRQIIAAVAARDLGAVQQATGSDRPERAFATLLVLAASLGDARQRV